MHAYAADTPQHQTNKRPPGANSDRECHGLVLSPPTLTIVFSQLLSLSLRSIRVSANLHAPSHPKPTPRPRLDLEAVVVDAREPSSHCSVPSISVSPLREYRGVAFERAMF